MSVVHDLSRMEFENIVLHIEVNPILFFSIPVIGHIRIPGRPRASLRTAHESEAHAG